MVDPYVNYKYKAATIIAEIYISDSNYIEALNHLDLIEKFPYLHYCGNALA